MRKVSESERIMKINSLCDGTIYSFVKWQNHYRDAKSKFVCNCEIHGEWVVSVDNFISKMSRCPKCSSNHPFDKNKVKHKLEDVCKTKGYHFIGWDGEYKNMRSKFVCQCTQHGQWVSRIHNFIFNDTGCPKCSISGYRNDLPGTLYALRSECGQFVKVGITNVSHERFKKLKYCTPFKFHIVELLNNEDGKLIQDLECHFQKNFQSAGFTGFDGCTEWLKWDWEIINWFRLLK